jgi:Flp pilus assembly pilin Flp
MNNKLKINGQSIIEYAVIVSVVVAALTAMSVYVQRSVQANLKTVENQINAQPTK